MRFFEAQALAKRNTWWLLLIFIVNVLLVAALNAVLVALFVQEQPTPHLMKMAFGGTCLFFLVAAAFFIARSSDGTKIAESMGGQRIGPKSQTESERRLLNIVEEMSLASGVAMPNVYVMKGDPSINAFAAGVDLNQTSIAVTQGCLDRLSRDELQAVIGHEYSHLLNDDLLLNIRLASAVSVFQLFVRIGQELMSVNNRRRSWTSSSHSKDRGPILLAGLGLCAIGGFGYLLGRMLQSFISKEREYLADASSAQFTRNPSALASALAKISSGGGSLISSPNKHDMAHIFFADAIFDGARQWFATHPPVQSRIERLVPGQNIDQLLQDSFRKMQQAADVTSAVPKQALAIEAQFRKMEQFQDLLSSIGQLKAMNLDASQAALGQIREWKEHLQNPDQARTALAISTFQSQKNYQDFIPHLAEMTTDFSALADLMQKNSQVRQSVFHLSLSTLKSLPASEKEKILLSMQKVFAQDNQLSLQEALLYFNAEQILLPALARRARILSFSQALKQCEAMMPSHEHLAYTELRNVLISLSHQSMAKKQEILKQLSSWLPKEKTEEFRLFAMALAVPMPAL